MDLSPVPRPLPAVSRLSHVRSSASQLDCRLNEPPGRDPVPCWCDSFTSLGALGSCLSPTSEAEGERGGGQGQGDATGLYVGFWWCLGRCVFSWFRVRSQVGTEGAEDGEDYEGRRSMRTTFFFHPK